MRRLLSRHRRERGAVAVEAALLVSIVLAPLLLGIVEMALFLREHTAATAMSRAGARAASQVPRLAAFDQVAADAIERSAATVPRDEVDFICVYDTDTYSNAAGDVVPPCKDGDAETLPTDCSANCVVYRWVDGTPGRFVYQTGSWSAADIDACQGDPGADSVGVMVQTSQPWFFGFLGSERAVRANTVMRFEPLYPDHTIPDVEPGCQRT